MTLKIILLLSVFTALVSCNGQGQKPSESKTTQLVAITIGDTVSDIGKNIDYILHDRNGNYWFASNGEGVYRYNGKTLTHITEKDGLCSNFIWTIEEDINGNLWFSTRDGFCRFNDTSFTNYTFTINNAPFAKLQYVKGGLFFGHLNGVCFYDGKSFTNFVIHPDNYHPSQSDMNRPYSIYSTLVDKTGKVWFGTQSQGVCCYDGSIFSYLTDKNLAGPAVRTMFQDKKGNMWFGNNGGGLYRYDGMTLRNITEEMGLGNPLFLKGHSNDLPGSLARVWSINEDKDGNLWVGTIDAGVWKYDGKNWKNYTTKDGLAGNAIWKIYKDKNDELWFVTNGETICKFNGNSFVKYEFH
jgi:ligand-binding sensor domain-containing protein